MADQASDVLVRAREAARGGPWSRGVLGGAFALVACDKCGDGPYVNGMVIADLLREMPDA